MNIHNADTTSIQDVVIPDAFKPPGWVLESFETFKKIIKEDYQKSNHINTSLVRRLIKDILLDGKISPPYPLNKKNVSKLLEKMFTLYNDEEFQWRYMLIYQAGFFLSTFTANSFTPETLILPAQFRKKRTAIIEEFRDKQDKASSENEREKNIMWVDKAFKTLTKEIMVFFRENRDQYPMIDSMDSGAKGGVDDLRKLIVAVGLSINSKGEINDVIDRSHSEALTPTQFFNYTSQAIVSQYKKSAETAIPGYLIRQLNTIMVSVVLSKTIDCKTDGRLNVKVLNKDMLESMHGKLYGSGNSLKSIDANVDTNLIGKTIKLRSALYCTSKDGICHTCYNPEFIERMNLQQNAGIGLLSSTAQASLLTSMTLKAAHTGLNLDKNAVDLTNDVFEFCD